MYTDYVWHVLLITHLGNNEISLGVVHTKKNTSKLASLFYIENNIFTTLYENDGMGGVI